MSSKDTYFILNNGHKMPKIGLGTFGSTDDAMRKTVRIALETGYRSLDTAFLYKNEDAIGDELRDWFAQGKLKREDVFVTSKLPAVGNRREDVSSFLTKSLKKLKLDFLDLYLIHHPFGLKYFGDDENVFPKDSNGAISLDRDTDLESLWKGLEAEVEAGRVKSIGVSNFNEKQISRLLKIAKIPPAVNQVEIHAYFQQHPLIEYCHQHGVAVTAYSPLGAPFTKEGSTVSPTLLQNPTVLEIGKRHGKTSGQTLLRFLYQCNVAVIPKSATSERIKSNFEILDFSLTEEEMKTMKQLDRGEEGRVYHFKTDFPGCETHKEYPF